LYLQLLLVAVEVVLLLVVAAELAMVVLQSQL